MKLPLRPELPALPHGSGVVGAHASAVSEAPACVRLYFCNTAFAAVITCILQRRFSVCAQIMGHG